ncbi:hypothetical protein [Vibrio hyugaensis]|uniref:hypothetical protein n=1 Tax=Vibrio hyugaensis TaxID=1534743 RepID=UPI000CE2C5EE|nr:hypothetical protein [Vibrio hyugaensis]
MRCTVTFVLLFMFSHPLTADDSDINPLAKKLKTKLQTKVDNKFDRYQGYCDVMIEMKHKGKKAAVKRVRGSGDKSVCRYIKSNLKVGKTYRYAYPEKYIRLHITTGN